MLRTDRWSVVRGLAPVGLLPPAALAVHELRYVLAFGGHAGVMLQRQGHSYLHSLVPWLVVLVALLTGGFLRSLGRSLSGQRSAPRFAVSFLALWLICAVSLVTIYAGQELLEGMLTTGHPAGLVGIFGFGGWWAIPSAVCVGLVLAAVLHGARWVLTEVAQRRGGALPRLRSACAGVLRPGLVAVPKPAPLAEGWSGRGPPA